MLQLSLLITFGSVSGQPVTFYAMVKNLGTAPVAVGDDTVNKVPVVNLQGLAQPLLPG